MKKMISAFAVVMCFWLAGGGCHKSGRPAVLDSEPIEPEVTDRTVGDLCELLGYQPVRVQGYSLVWGLPGTGASECPPAIRTALLEMIRTTGARDFMAEPYRSMPGEELINSLDTAAVLVSGDVLPGVPRGGIFNVFIRIPWASQATSLQGGYLIPSDLREVVLGQRGPLVGPVTAQAMGPVFTDPFVRKTETGESALLRATVLGGGRSLRDRRIQLALTDPDYRVAQHLQRRINMRFVTGGGRKVADALDRSRIEITVPPAYRDNYEHFFKLLLALYFRDDVAFQKQKLVELSNRALEAGADYERIALEWEAIGRQALSFIEPFYETPADELAYYAARTALNLGHYHAIDAMVRIAGDDGHPRQVDALEYLGRLGDRVRVRRLLIDLLNHPRTQIRLLAYEGLRRAGDPRIKSYPSGGGFRLELVEATEEPMIYVWADIDPRIILFGKNLVARREVFYETPDRDLTINGRPEDPTYTIIRTLPGSGQHIEVKCSMVVEQLIRALVRAYDTPGDPGAGLTLSQAARVLKDLCEQRVIPAKYHLHTWKTRQGTTVTGQEPAVESRGDTQGPG